MDATVLKLLCSVSLIVSFSLVFAFACGLQAKSDNPYDWGEADKTAYSVITTLLLISLASSVFLLYLVFAL